MTTKKRPSRLEALRQLGKPSSEPDAAAAARKLREQERRRMRIGDEINGLHLIQPDAQTTWH
jgi:hypothetical protein